MSQGPAAPALAMRGVRKAFGAVRALDGVDLEVRAGEVHALVGENGAGKSTLMKVLAGAERADAGEMELSGAPYRPAGPADARRRGVAMIYQELNLAPHLTVEENVMLGREARRFGFVRRREMRPRVERALALLEQESLSPRARVGSLGPGAQQVVEIARALAGDARVVVMDEPTSSLSRQDAERLFRVVERLRAEGVAVVYISHFLEEVQRVAQRFTVLRDGRTIGTGEVASTSIEAMLELMVGRALDQVFPRVARERGETLLELDGIAGERLPSSAALALARGEILGIAGLVGAGRTELLRAVYGLDPVRTGRVRVRAVEVPPRGPRAAVRRGLGLVSEDRKGEGLAAGLSVEENLTLSNAAPFTRGGWIERGARREAARRWIETFGIRCGAPDQPVAALSGGNQQKVALARLLHQEADVLLLDEPTRGVDVASKVEIYRAMGELAAQGKAILMVSSYLPELLGVCDRIAVMHRGVLGPARAREEWTEHALLDEATRGSARAEPSTRRGV